MLMQLKRGHWIDGQTRLITIQMQMRNNNRGIRFIVRYMFEVTQMGAVLPSYDMETLIDDEDNTEVCDTSMTASHSACPAPLRSSLWCCHCSSLLITAHHCSSLLITVVLSPSAKCPQTMRLWMTVSLALTLWFAFLEGVELLQSGPVDYFTNMWNVMDWTNFALFGVAYMTLSSVLSLNERDKTGENCVAPLCAQFGFYDLWEVFDTARDAKFFLSVCVCIQLLKIIKFTNVIIPKMSLMTRVLSKGCYDLLFFGIIFGVSMFAFCMLFYIQLGSFMDDFHSQTSSMIALAKALFGEFPFDEIVDNSRGYTNGILFLVYLFVAVFILLSMFLAILGEAQAAVRDEEASLREQGVFPNQYGFLGEAKEWVDAKVTEMRAPTPEDAATASDAEKQASEVNDNPGLDQAMNKALFSMHKKLEASVQTRMASMEQRLLNQLTLLDNAIGSYGKGAGSMRCTGRRGSAVAVSASLYNLKDGSRDDGKDGGKDGGGGSRERSRLRTGSMSPAHARSGSPDKCGRAGVADARRDTPGRMTGKQYAQYDRDDGRAADGRAAAPSAGPLTANERTRSDNFHSQPKLSEYSMCGYAPRVLSRDARRPASGSPPGKKLRSASSRQGLKTDNTLAC